MPIIQVVVKQLPHQRVAFSSSSRADELSHVPQEQCWIQMSPPVSCPGLVDKQPAPSALLLFIERGVLGTEGDSSSDGKPSVRVEKAGEGKGGFKLTSSVKVRTQCLKQVP